MTTIKQALDALSAIGLTDTVVWEENDGNIILSLNRVLDHETDALVFFPDTNPDDPEG